MYDTTRVQMAPVLLFAQELPVVRRTGTHTTFRLAGWSVAVKAPAASELLSLRASLHAFIQRSVGEPPSELHLAATEALSRVFSEHAPVQPAGLHDEDDDDDDAAFENFDIDGAVAAAVAAGAGTPKATASSSSLAGGAGKRAWDDEEEEEEAGPGRGAGMAMDVADTTWPQREPPNAAWDDE